MKTLRNFSGPKFGSHRVIRGGAWWFGPLYSRVAYRGWAAPGCRFDDVGFRLMKTLRNPSGPKSGSYRVIRGGAWWDGPLNLRAAIRFWTAPGIRSDDVGFRLARICPFTLPRSVSHWVIDFDLSTTASEPGKPVHQMKTLRNPSGPKSGSCRVIRGGAWWDGPRILRAASRFWTAPGFRVDSVGFRLARTCPFTLEPGKPPEPPIEEKAERIYEPYEVFRDEPEAPEMVYLPGGTFEMGDIQGDGFDRERPVHQVTLDAFAIGRYPVTVDEYLRFVESTGSHHPEWLEEGSKYHFETGKESHYRRAGIGPKETRHPITGISWDDAAAYCEWLSEQTGERYSLPTESQWEYACRASSTTRYGFGDDDEQLGAYAWYSENAEEKLHPVGEKRANDWGLYDMHGNVWEWVHDWYDRYDYDT